MHKRVGEVDTMLNATVSELSLNKHKICAKVYNLSFLKHRFIHLTIFFQPNRANIDKTWPTGEEQGKTKPNGVKRRKAGPTRATRAKLGEMWPNTPTGAKKCQTGLILANFGRT